MGEAWRIGKQRQELKQAGSEKRAKTCSKCKGWSALTEVESEARAWRERDGSEGRARPRRCWQQSEGERGQRSKQSDGERGKEREQVGSTVCCVC